MSDSVGLLIAIFVFGPGLVIAFIILSSTWITIVKLFLILLKDSMDWIKSRVSKGQANG